MVGSQQGLGAAVQGRTVFVALFRFFVDAIELAEEVDGKIGDVLATLVQGRYGDGELVVLWGQSYGDRH